MTRLKHRSGALLAGALAVLVGGVVLLGWALNIAALKSVLPVWVCMKPNTAGAFILTGIAVLFARPLAAPNSAKSQAGPRLSTFLSRLSRFCALLAGLIGLLSLCEYAFEWNPGFDQWLFPEPAGAVGTSHPGRMAPDAALCFVLFAAGWEFARRPRQTNRTVVASLLFGAAMTTIALVEILSYFTPALRTYGWGGLTMMALPTATVFAALGAALILTAWSENRPESASPANALAASGSRASWMFLLVFFLLAVGIVATGTFYYRYSERSFRAEAEQQISAIADLKMGELLNWRKERMADGAVLFRNAVLSDLVRRVLEKPENAESQRLMQAWLGKYANSYQYNQVRLLDTQGVTRLLAPAAPAPVSSSIVRGASEVLRSGQVAFQDFYRNEHDQRIYLAVMVPILDESDANRPLGVLVLRIDPETYLYPFIKRWPTASRTAETLLVRREGKDALFLNELRFQTNTALTLRSSLANTNMPAVKAALGQEGTVAGLDYRGVPVLAAVRSIADSPWFLVARRDLAEVYAPLRAQLWQVIAMISVLLFGAGAGVGLVWRQQRLGHYKEKAEVVEALQKSQRLLTQAEKLGRVGGWEFDIETRQQTWTETVYDIHELDSTGQPTVDQGINYYTPASRPIIERAVQRAIEQGEPFDLELEIITAKGNLRSVHTVGKADLACRKVTGFIQDITERKQAEKDLRQSRAAALNMMEDAIAARDRTEQAHEALRASEERYRTILQTALDGICLVDMQGRLLEVNAAYCRMSGYSAQELLAMRITDLEDVEETDATAAHFQNIIAQGDDCFETRHRRKDGSIFYVEVSVQFRSDEGEHFVAFLHDITKRKRAEEEYAKLLVQFVQAQKMESVGRLAGGVAHDFNNLLMIIMGNADLCRDLIEPGHPIRELLDDITSGAQRSAEITRQLLAFARKQTIAPKIMDLNDAVAGMLKLLRRLIGEDINLVWRPGVDLPLVKLDTSQIDQILANLCVNSRDAIAGVGNITLETGSIAIDAEYCARHPEAIPGAYVFLAVSDDGCGMNKETLAYVFEPFFTTKGLGKGTGLGLATVYGIVKQNNGFIYAYSEPGKGTTFKIYLPQIAAEAVATTVTSKTEAPRGRGETVLLVEDEKPLRVICGLFLEALDYKVLVAETPVEALKMTDRHPGDIHLLLTDVVMPGMNGRQLAKRISAVKPGIKVLFISGYTADVIAQRGVLDEGVQFLSKPFTRDALARKVRDVLEGPRPG